MLGLMRTDHRQKMQQSWKVREMDPGADVDQQPVRSLQDQHELTNQGPSARLEILSDNTTTVPIHPYVAPLDTEQGVQNLDGNAKLATLNSKQSQERTQQSTDNEVEVATPLDVQTTGIAGPGPVDESMTGQPEPDELLTSPDLETQFKIIFHLPNNETLMRCAQLDTGAKGVNLLSQDVMDDLKEYGLPMEPYEGPKIKPLGALIKPMGQIKLPWSVRRFPKTYSHTFLVLDSQSTSGFDALLGDTTINQVGFFIRNHKVWLSDQQRV